MNKLCYILTGCPCSGTHYIARSLTLNGFRTSHEAANLRSGESSDKEARADVSYLHVQWLDVVELPVVHVVRDPLKVFNSYLAYAVQERSDLSPNDCAKFLADSNEAVENHSTTIYRHRVEDPLQELLEVLGVPIQDEVKEAGHWSVHLNKGRCNFSWSDLGWMPAAARLKEQAERYGYL